MLKLVNTNFTEQMTTMKLNFENANKDRMLYHLEAIQLRREKASLEEWIEKYEKSCKEDFVSSLQGIPNVTRQFLQKVDDLFMKHESFQLTCDKQSTKLEDIRVNCSSLSREVENKLQMYLDRVGSQVTALLGANAKYQTKNKLLAEDAMWCKGNLSATVEQKQKDLTQTQLKHDEEKEKLLLQVRQLTENGKLNENLLTVKNIDIKILNEKVNSLNMSLTTCKVGFFLNNNKNNKKSYNIRKNYTDDFKRLVVSFAGLTKKHFRVISLRKDQHMEFWRVTADWTW